MKKDIRFVAMMSLLFVTACASENVAGMQAMQAAGMLNNGNAMRGVPDTLLPNSGMGGMPLVATLPPEAGLPRYAGTIGDRFMHPAIVQRLQAAQIEHQASVAAMQAAVPLLPGAISGTTQNSNNVLPVLVQEVSRHSGMLADHERRLRRRH